MGVWARLAWGPGVLATGAFWVLLAAPTSSPSHSSALSLGLGDINILRGRCRFEGLKEVGDYDEYEDEYVNVEGEAEEDYEYEYVDLQKDSDGDGLRDHINDPDDDNDGIPDLEDDDDDGDGVNDREDSDWFAHDEM